MDKTYIVIILKISLNHIIRYAYYGTIHPEYF